MNKQDIDNLSNIYMESQYIKSVNEVPQIGQRYIWDGLSVVVKDIQSKYRDAVEHPDGSVSPPRTTYSVFIEYVQDGKLFSFWTPWTSAGFKKEI